MHELISIIVPVFNIDQYLSRCIDSVLNQSYADYELILIDDGSTDTSPALCDRYADQDSRIKVLHIENGGPSKARNTGIDVASGEYITFVDGDDWIHKEYLKTLIGLINDNQADLAMINHIKTHRENLDEKVKTSKEYNVKVLSNIETLELFFGKYNHYLVAVWGKLYKRGLFDSIRFDVGRLHEDVFILYKLFFKARCTVLSTNPLYYYWKREGSITGTFYVERQIDHLTALTERAVFFYDMNLLKLFKTQAAILLKQYIRLVKYFDINTDRQHQDDIASCYRSISELFRNRPVGIVAKLFNCVYEKAPRWINKVLFNYGQITLALKNRTR